MFKCDQCSYECNWKGKIRTHKASLHEQASNECDRCDYKMKWKPPFLEHRRQKHGIFVRKPKNYEEMQFAESLCESCGFSARSVKELRRHEESNHKITEKTEEKGLGGYKNFPSVYIICGDCERKWAPTSDLQHHGNIKHVELAALFCDTMPQNNKKLRRHIPEGYSDKEKLICQSCGNLFEEEKVLRFHITSRYEDDEDEEGNKSSTFMVSMITITCRMIEIHENKLGPSWAKIRHNWNLML